jgi:hypothetical protein
LSLLVVPAFYVVADRLRSRRAVLTPMPQPIGETAP